MIIFNGLTDHGIVTEMVISVLKTHDKLNAFLHCKILQFVKKKQNKTIPQKTAELLTYMPCTRGYINNK